MTREEAIKILSYRDANGVPCGYAGGITEALDMAIKALEQEPSGDLISRKSAKHANYKVCLSEGNKDIFVKILDEINKLSSIEQEPCSDAVSRQAVHRQINKWVASGESEKSLLSLHNRMDTLPPVNPQEPSGETVSREAVNDILGHCIHDQEDYRDAVKMLYELPSVEPSGDVISRQAVIDQTYLWSKDEFLRVTNPFDYLRKRIMDLPSVKQEPKTGHWINKYHEVFKYYCDKCGTGSDLRTQYCPNCGAKMVEPQESEDKE